jgi:rhodanese-related sulfurtransferase
LPEEITVTDSPSATISAKELHELLGGSAEFALIDVREARGTAEQGSILLAVSLPLSGLELQVGRLIPRRSTPVIVYDGGDGDLAGRGAARLRELGYTDVKTLAGGITAWSEAGYKVHTGGDRVVGQAFGEWIEEIYGTPHVSVPDYLAKVAAGEDLVLLDSRPLPEFQNHSLPNGTSIPGAELVYRARELVTSPDSLVVVHCAGRTRSILGAQVLINAGLPNKVVALEGGTQSWVLEGHELDHGHSSAAPLPSPEALAAAKAGAEHIAERFAVPTIDQATLASFQAEEDQRTLYLLDVRTPEEFAEGHLAGSVSAPSWDVAPWVFRYVGTHNARTVLVDNDLVRATVAASWLVQFGWGEVFVLADALTGQTLETGPVPAPVLGLPAAGYDLITPAQLQAETGAQVIDLQPSTSYKTGHIPGAIFASRAQLPALAGKIPGSGPIVVSSEDGVLARFAAAELSAVTSRPVRVLDGGNAAWLQAGYGLSAEDSAFLHEPFDAVASGWRETEPEAQKAGFRRYLSWELGLVAELREDDTVPFKTFA